MPRPTTRRSPAPSQFPNSSVNHLSRRQLLAGAGSALGAGAVLGALGPAGVSALGRANGGHLVQTPSGTVTFGSNYSDELPLNAFQATIDAFANPDIEVSINTVDHNSFQQNITNYLQQPDDLMTWFAGYRLQFFAAQGLLGDISDVWADLTGFSDGFKNACTGEDGNQYMVPFYNYPWAIHYSKSLWEERGYTAPATWDELIALCDQMQADGITPFSIGNSDGWPAMGTFDILNMRINGYDFHVSLMAGEEDWTSDQVKEAFAQWTTLLPYYQEGPNGRTWQEAAQSLKAHETGMYMLGTFVSEQFADNLDDLDFFAYPALNDEFGTDSIDAPIDGFMMAAEPQNPEAAKEVLRYLGTPEAAIVYLTENPGSVAANSEADTSGYTALQVKSAELIGATANIAQFLDRDTNPEFASNVMIDALTDFLADPSSIDSILDGVEERKQVIFEV
jgi:multiple sugar transport system substrate-binding protein